VNQNIFNLKRNFIALGAVAAAACADPTAIARPISNEALLATSGGNGATQNGQSIMVTPTFEDFILIQGSETWHLNLANARSYYTTNVTGPTVTCTGSATNCGAANQPATPAAPAADPTEPSNAYFAAGGDKNRCIFWNGGDPDAPSSYTQSVTINGLNGNGNWKFTWTYSLVAPVGIAAHTAWDLISSTSSGDAEVEITGFVAGQSVVKKIKAAKNDWAFKVSHTINDGLGGHRVVGLAYSVDGGTPVYFDALTQLQLETGVDFYYSQNSGNNGFANLLVDGAFVNVIQNGGKAAYSGELDDFLGNNATLGERVNFFGPKVTLGDGTHSIVLTGTVKGNSGLGDLGINIQKTVTIDAQGCQNQ
jgi:hypothetical protein